MRKLILLACGVFVLLTSFETDRSKPKLPTEFKYIPAGSFQYDEKTISVEAMYASRYEVSNLQYRTFLDETATTMSEQEKRAASVDGSGWTKTIPHSEPMEKHYFSNRAYNDFPVVNVTYEGAMLYCAWLQKKLQGQNPGFHIQVRLPSRNEYMWLAMGGRNQAMFPWSNYYLRNSKGEPMCNFKTVPDQRIYRDKKTGEVRVVKDAVGYSSEIQKYTASVKSFSANDYGLYNTCGNAAEMVAESGKAVGGSWNDYGGDVHIRAEASFERLSPTVGFRPVIVAKEKQWQ